ncbi:MAG: winged helix-turn-helix transcriptional regulator [Clostridia bacterium]|nr:winged helix-turn-helix transcriptional regulator [Clostridia bacterium]
MTGNEILIGRVLETFDSINIEMLFDKLKFSLKGENMLMSILNSLGGQGTAREITQYFDFTPARLSALVKTLEAKGFVEKIQNEDDRRTSTIILTSEGSMQYLRYREEAIKNALVLVEYLGEEDIHELLRIIKKISDISNNIDETTD